MSPKRANSQSELDGLRQGNKLLIHLDKINQIGGMLDKIEIIGVTFDEVNANVAFKV